MVLRLLVLDQLRSAPCGHRKGMDDPFSVEFSGGSALIWTPIDVMWAGT